jgi:hypothetical protein
MKPGWHIYALEQGPGGPVPMRISLPQQQPLYHVHIYPSTFLIGKDGRVYFRPHIYNDIEERTAGLELEELLVQSGQ